MDKLGLVESFSDFKETKNIDRVTMMSIMEEVFRNIIIKRYGTDENIDFIINTDRGDLEIWRRRVIVNDDDLEDDVLEIPYSEAIKIERSKVPPPKSYIKSTLLSPFFMLSKP